MAWELLFCAMPGYFGLFLFYRSKEIPHKGTWDFFVKIAPAAVVTFAIACFSESLISVTPLLKLLLIPGNSLNEYFHYDFVFRFVLACTVGAYFFAKVALPLFRVICGIKHEKTLIEARLESLLSKSEDAIDEKQNWLKRKFINWLYDKKEKESPTSSGLVIVHLKNKKVYVGSLVRYSRDTPINELFIEITPVISGYRKSDNLQVVMDVNYLFDTPEIGYVPDRDVLLRFDEVISIARYDQHLYEKFKANGQIIEEFPKSTLPEEPLITAEEKLLQEALSNEPALPTTK